ncbi:tyrosine-type recombinase/integrase [Phyllobacterium ifriqiyense]|uniref:tyrosine-type recombinase/integrase n=1 Tax=Phyllobacterium ifriqiyense TaxID=314238 RepID=UPI003391AC9D
MGKITKKVVEALVPRERPYLEWDAGDGAVKGFGVNVHPSGRKVFVAQFRIGSGRAAKEKRVSVGAFGTWTVEQARDRARDLIREGQDGIDRQAAQKATKDAKDREEAISEKIRLDARNLRFNRLAVRYMRDHVRLKRKANTVALYRHLLAAHILPKIGRRDARDIKRTDLITFHNNLRETPIIANRSLALIAGIYSWAEKAEIIAEGTRNPATKIEKFKETAKDRFLSVDELRRLGEAIRQAETVGIPWEPNPNGKVKHAPKEENRRTFIEPGAAAALRLLIFTGARLREILHLRWSHVDLERGLLRLADSKTGAKTVILNAPARAVLATVDRSGEFVIKGESRDGEEQPRHDLKRPWALVIKVAGLDGVRIHDLRHSFASIGVGDGMGLPIVGKLLGHAQSRTTARYAHLDDDPLRKASDAIATKVAQAMGELPLPQSAEVVPLRREAK